MTQEEFILKFATNGAEITQARVDALTRSVNAYRDASGNAWRDAQGRLRDAQGRFVAEAGGAASAADRMGKGFRSAGDSAALLGRVLAGLAIKELAMRVLELGDTYINWQNKIKVVTEGQESLAFITQELVGVAERSRTSLEAVTTVYARTSRAVQVLGKSQMETLRFTETLNKAILVGGSTAVEAQNAMIQLSQGMSSGTLRGDELRSVLEQLPIVADLIADKLGVTVGQLRKLGAEGKLTSEQVFDAIVEGTDEIEDAFSKMTPTVAQAFQVLKNEGLLSMQALQEANGKLANGILYLAKNFDVLIDSGLALANVLAVALAVRGFGALEVGMVRITAFVASNPFGALALAIGLATAALIPFADNMQLVADRATTVKDVGVTAFEEIKEVVDGINFQPLTDALNGLTSGTMLQKLAVFADLITTPLRFMADPLKAFGLSQTPFQDMLKGLAEAGHEQAQLRLEQENLGKRSMSYQMAIGRARAEEHGKKVPIPGKAQKESGKTFDEILSQLSDQQALIRMRDNPLGLTINSQVNEIGDTTNAEALQKAQQLMAQLKDSVRHSLDPTQLQQILDLVLEIERAESQLVEDKRVYQEEVKRQLDNEELIAKSIQEQLEAEIKLIEAQKKKREDIIEKAGGVADPDKQVKDQIQEMKDLLEVETDRNIATVLEKAINTLERSLTPMGLFADQMNGVFGANGSLVTGMANAASQAILFSNSWKDVLNTVKDLARQLQQQVFSSFIQLGINSAFGIPMKPFAAGGYTGDGPAHQPAGIVHAGEWVSDAATTRQFRPQLEAMSKGRSPGASIVVNNNAPGVHVESSTTSNGEIMIMIEKAIVSKVPGLMASQIGEENSKVSKALSSALEGGRNRR